MQNRVAGFTLVEVMIVITLSALLMLAASSVFLTLLAGRAKTANDQQLKNEGTQALNQMEFIIRNSIKMLPTVSDPTVTCRESPPTSELVVQSVDGGITRFYQQADQNDGGKLKIASNSAVFLTSGNVTLTDGPHFTCIDNQGKGNRFVTIDFTLTKNSKSQEFTDSVNVRNY